MTTLSRMHAKRALTREARGRGYVYALPDTPDTAQASMTAFQMQRLLDSESDRAGVLAQFVANLDRERRGAAEPTARRDRAFGMIALALIAVRGTWPAAVGRCRASWLTRCRPRQAAVTLTVLALAVSLATGLILCVAACLADRGDPGHRPTRATGRPRPW